MCPDSSCINNYKKISKVPILFILQFLLIVGVFDTGAILKGFKYFTINRRGNIVKQKIKSHKV